jgi:hypothetical protein
MIDLGWSAPKRDLPLGPQRTDRLLDMLEEERSLLDRP